MVKLNWTDRAIDDLHSIAEFIGSDSEKYARITIERLRERARQLIYHPLSGRCVPELEDPDVRELVLGSYRIIYLVVSPNRVDILTVHHSARALIGPLG